MAAGLLAQALDVHAAATADPYADPDASIALLVRLLGAQVRAGATDAARHTRQRAVDLAVRADRDDLVAAVYGAWTEPSHWRSRLEGLFDRTALALLERLRPGCRRAAPGPVRGAAGRGLRHPAPRAPAGGPVPPARRLAEAQRRRRMLVTLRTRRDGTATPTPIIRYPPK
ncbi:hypothetical protein AB0953_25080 [Streptomyces sp. NPDC046866]|uniref:hypothetical protein n=1 Tax=Streptomyces sp. NPDC046866 TaxID=3154921 RepID=UPI0034567341